MARNKLRRLQPEELANTNHAAPPDQLLADRGEMHLIRPVADADKAGIDVSAREKRVLGDAGGAVDLDGAIDDTRGHAGDYDLGGGDQIARSLVAVAVHLVSGLQREQPRLRNLAEGMRNVLTHRALLGERLAEGRARDRALAHQFQRALGAADQTHAMMDATGAQSSLRDLEAAAFAEQ